jgi:hypothetical protein
MVVDTLVNLSVGTTSTIGHPTALDIVRIDELRASVVIPDRRAISGPVLEGALRLVVSGPRLDTIAVHDAVIRGVER